MKVLMIAANRDKFPDPVFPLGASYVAQALVEAGHKVDIFDACFSENVLVDLRDSILEALPDLICISLRNVDNITFPIATNYLPYYKELITVCREHSYAPIVAGGSAFSIFPELYMEKMKPDYGIVGEGEVTIVELAEKLEQGLEPEDRLIKSPRLNELSKSQFPLREGFDSSSYNQLSGCVNIQTKRGCAFQCSYCSYPLLEGSDYRLRTINSVVDEIEYWNCEKGADFFFFVDSVFNFPDDYSVNICREIIRRGLKLSWTGFFAPHFLDSESLDIYLESGLNSIDFGTDAFSPLTLKGYNKFFTVDDVFKSCELCSSKKIGFNHSLIMGGPAESYATLKETIDNTKATGPTSVIGLVGVRLFPNTPLAAELNYREIGLEPLFYIAEEVKEGILDFIHEQTASNSNWLIPGLNRGTNMKLFKRMRKRGIRGPLWTMASKYSYSP